MHLCQRYHVMAPMTRREIRSWRALNVRRKEQQCLWTLKKRKSGQRGRPDVFVQEQVKCSSGWDKKKSCVFILNWKKKADLVDKHRAGGSEHKESPKQFLPSCGRSHNHAVGRPETPQPSLFGLIFSCSTEDETSTVELDHR